MSGTDGETGPRSRVARSALAAVLTLLLVASFVWLILGLRSDDDSGEGGADDRAAAMLAARSYVEAASNFGPSDLDEQKLLTAYRDRVTPLISTSYREEFDKQVDNVTPLAVQGFATTTTVDRVGVVEISADRATVLVGGETARAIQNKTEQPQGYTLELTLVKVGGNWLIDQTPCNVAQNPECTTAPAPSATETPTGQPEPDEQPTTKKSSKGEEKDQRR
ncbi:hypothetical protein [Nocardioides daejeonensis]|uniref:hypothetical protein n=1 Tax=Nocardioides daejeonensis TaxID=1046556 RepID=UPI000D747601|nr:hypothetical protein [Nocardioides daejeonensis]